MTRITLSGLSTKSFSNLTPSAIATEPQMNDPSEAQCLHEAPTVLYAHNLPTHISYLDVEQTFRICNMVVSATLFQEPSESGSEEAPNFAALIEFMSVADAEKALATIQLCYIPGVVPEARLILSKSRLLEQPTPPTCYTGRVVKHLPQGMTAFELYDLVRPFGPIEYVEVTQEIGGILHFKDEEHAHLVESRLARLELVPYEPSKLCCTNLGPTITKETFQGIFDKLDAGPILSLEVTWNISGRYGFVTYASPLMALKAMESIDASTLGQEAAISFQDVQNDSPKPLPSEVAMRAELEALTLERNQLRNALKTTVESVRNEAQAELEALRSKLSDQERTSEAALRLQKEQDDLSASALAAKSTRLEVELTLLRRGAQMEQDVLRSKSTRLEVELALLRRGAQMERDVLRSKLADEKRDSQAALRLQKVQDDFWIRESKRMDAEFANAETELDSLRSKLSAQKGIAHTLQQERDELSTSLAAESKNAETQLAFLRISAHTELDTLASKLSDQENITNRFQKERDDLSASLAALAAESKNAETKLALLRRDTRSELEALRSKLSDQEGISDRLQKERDDVSASLAAESQRMDTELALLRRSTQTELDALGSKLTDQERISHNLQKERDRLSASLAVELKHAEIKFLSQQRNAQAGLDALRSKLSNQESISQRLQKERDDLSSSLGEQSKSLNTELTILRSKLRDQAEQHATHTKELEHIVEDQRVKMELDKHQIRALQDDKHLANLREAETLWSQHEAWRKGKESIECENARLQAEILRLKGERAQERAVARVHQEKKEKAKEDEAEKKMREKEAKERRDREDAERVLREKEEQRRKEEIRRREEERLERERLQEQRRLEKWRHATQDEIRRCRTRDQQPAPSRWTPSSALKRFSLLLVEMEQTEFSEERPLTFGSIPWPTLQYPLSLQLQHVNSGTIKTFLDYAKGSLPAGDFKLTHRKMQITFHPDKWNKALKSVMEEQLREQLYDKITTVSQMINGRRVIPSSLCIGKVEDFDGKVKLPKKRIPVGTIMSCVACHIQEVVDVIEIKRPSRLEGISGSIQKMMDILQTPLLFAPNLPSTVSHDDLRLMFEGLSVTEITLSSGFQIIASTKEGWRRLRKSDVQTAAIHFVDIAAAEMAFAIMNQCTVPKISPSVTLKLSSSPNKVLTSYTKPRFLTPCPPNLTVVELYKLIRPFGRLLSTRVDSRLGGVVQFWTEEEAQAAELAVENAFAHDSCMKLQSYDYQDSSSDRDGGDGSAEASLNRCAHETKPGSEMPRQSYQEPESVELGTLRAEKSRLEFLLDESNSRVRVLELQIEAERRKAAMEVTRQKGAIERDAHDRAQKDAVIAEVDRCRQRDARLCQWDHSTALKRFLLVLEEFECRAFSETQPPTFEGIPWPMLDNPFLLQDQTTAVTWEKVETFFRFVKGKMALQKYRKLVEKVHRLFHPDKWRYRRILDMIHDPDLRQSVESSVNIVAQAMTPLWRESKEDPLGVLSNMR
ncbi:hypothetical protein DXG01_011558 [Tephrocybe rancida]|nr:hypothetical protein DXG01_011558 [Tephrocybe rancida]